VDSPVRAFRAVGGVPPFIRRGQGSHLYDVDGNDFIDFVCSWGALILGHAHPQIVKALKEAVDKGTSYGASTVLETCLAKLICQAMPSIEMVRFVNSGTEAVMSALRLARAFTGRDKIVKFEGCYHGHADGLLVRAGSGAMTFGLPDSRGVPDSYAQQTVVAPYNDISQLEDIFKSKGAEIAAVIVEPVAANMGVVLPDFEFLSGLRQLTRDYGSVLIFDEVITGFRVGFGGAQRSYNVIPDLTCLGKIIGGGLPVGAYGGKREIMEMVAPLGPVYQAGTLSGNPLAMTAGIKTLRIISSPGTYDRLERLSAYLADGLRRAAEENGVEVFISRAGSLLTMFFTAKPVTDYSSAKSVRVDRYKVFFNEMLQRGIYLPPSQFEALFISLAHTEQDIEKAVRAAEEGLRVVSKAPSG
jgi:glutamate-1-semialdehyde 2,1-aminomutase